VIAIKVSFIRRALILLVAVAVLVGSLIGALPVSAGLSCADMAYLYYVYCPANWQSQNFSSVGACQSYVLTTSAASYGLTPESCGWAGIIYDDRINHNAGAPRAVYCDDDSIDVWKVVNEAGVLEFSIFKSDLPDSVSVQTLIKQVGATRLYMLPDGNLKLLAIQDDGKTYFFIFDPSSCTPIQEGADWQVE